MVGVPQRMQFRGRPCGTGACASAGLASWSLLLPDVRYSLSAVPGSLLAGFIYSFSLVSPSPLVGVIKTGLGNGGAYILGRLHLERGSPMPRSLPDGAPVLWPTSPMGSRAHAKG